MAIIKVNDRAVTYKMQKSTAPKLKTATTYISDELKLEAVDNAYRAGSTALAHFNLYDTDCHIYKGLVQLATIKFDYNQDNLVPAIGSDTEDYRHTSFVGEWYNPDDYRMLVNSGHAGLGKEPPWNGNGGYWDKTLEQIPDIVKTGLFKAGFKLL